MTSPAAGEPGNRGPAEDESRRGRVPVLRGHGRAVPYLELVLLPYNLILNEKSREALGLDLHVGAASEGHA